MGLRGYLGVKPKFTQAQFRQAIFDTTQFKIKAYKDFGEPVFELDPKREPMRTKALESSKTSTPRIPHPLILISSSEKGKARSRRDPYETQKEGKTRPRRDPNETRRVP